MNFMMGTFLSFFYYIVKNNVNFPGTIAQGIIL